MKKTLLIIALFLFAASTQAQFVDQVEPTRSSRNTSIGIEPAVTPFSLLDFSKVRWSHSYSVSFFSGGQSSSSLGLWNTKMIYDFSSKLSLALNIGVAHNPGAVWGDENNSSTILPGFKLDYRPSENFRISVGMQTYRGNYFTNPYYFNSLQEEFYR